MADLSVRPPFTSPAPAVGRTRPGLPRIERRTFWRALWSPFWFWSDLPAPDLPALQPNQAAPLGPAGEVFLSGLDAIRRRLWVRHALLILVRAVWLGLAGATLWVAIGLPLGGPALDVRLLGRILVALLGLGLVFAILAKPDRVRTARMLDRTFGLQERMTTAVEDLGRQVPAPGQQAPVIYLQMADGANAIDELRRHPALGWRVPTREIVLAVFWALLLAAIAFLRGVGGGVPPLAAAVVPPFTPAIERPEDPPPVPPTDPAEATLPTVQDVLDRSARSAEARRDLEALAAALADHAVTNDTSAAIRDGAYDRAAAGLRELAPEAGALSEASRGELASDLERAAGQMSPDGEGLQPASEEAATGLRQGEQPAAEGLRSLAEAVERTGAEVAPQSELADQMQQAQQAASQGAQGQPQAATAQQQGQSSAASQPQGPLQSGADPGAGADAQAQTGAAGAPGDPSQGQSGEPGQSDRGGAPGNASQPGESSQAGQGDQPGEFGQTGREGQAQGSGDADAAAQGGGAGSGQSQEQPADAQAAPGGGDGQQPNEGEAAEERVADGDGGSRDADALANVTEAISLPPGQGDQGVQTSADGGSSLLGSGAGVTAGSGTSIQGEVGEAGPDSNHVPPEHRGLVERYFGDPFGALEPGP